MKEVQKVETDKIEISKPVEHLKKISFLGSVKKQPNMNVYECSLVTGDVVVASMELVIGSKGKLISQVKVKENHIYCYALNGKNAVRKFAKSILNGRVR